MAKNEEENTGYITQSTRHSMLVSCPKKRKAMKKDWEMKVKNNGKK